MGAGRAPALGSVDRRSLAEGGQPCETLFAALKRCATKDRARISSELVIQFAFTTLGLKSVWLVVRTKNVSAVRLFSRLGFTVVENAA